MPWVLASIAGLGLFLVGKARGWWGGAPPIVCDVETDMPDAMKQQVLAQLAANKDPASLNALAMTLSGSGYVQSAYCLAYQAWVLGGKQGAAPAAPTQAQIAAAQAQRTAAQGLAAAGTAAQAAAAALGGQSVPSPTSVLQQMTSGFGSHRDNVMGTAAHRDNVAGYPGRTNPEIRYAKR